MKRLFSLLVALLLVASMLMLTGCSKQKAEVESFMQIDSNFAGYRNITVTFPLNVSIDELSQQIMDSNPFAEDNESTFEYVGVEKDGYTFVMNLVFSSHDDYISQVSELVGRKVSSYMAQPNTLLTKGSRMLEDFDVSELIGFITKLTASNEETKKVEFDYSENTVVINGTEYETESTIDVSQLEGEPINSIMIETTNLKDGLYDRTVTFSIPNKTYTDLQGSIKQYFMSNTSEYAHYCDWTNLGASWEYKVIYKSITLDQMIQFTAMLLDTEDNSIFYGDKNNSSTPLSEGMAFEETLNTFSFIGNSLNDVNLIYKYALPIETTHGEGSIYTNGVWKNTGSWQEGVYFAEISSDVIDIKISDGIEYSINGIRFDLEVVGENDFVRTTEFLYSKTQGMDALLYARDFFEQKGATVEIDEDDDNLICRVINKGSCEQITTELEKYFGSGNYVAYENRDSKLSLSAKTKFTDCISLSHMLNSTNANRPMTYTVRSSCNENINGLMNDGVSSAKLTEKTDVLTVDITGGNGMVIYNGNIPNTVNIVIYSVVGGLMVVLTLCLIVFMLYKQRRRKAYGSDVFEDVALQQTTTFSVSELAALSDRSNKKYRDEIDREIEQKIEADRIESLSRELKAKEIAQLEKMIYGTPDEKEQEKTQNSDVNLEQEQKDI